MEWRWKGVEEVEVGGVTEVEGKSGRGEGEECGGDRVKMGIGANSHPLCGGAPLSWPLPSLGVQQYCCSSVATGTQTLACGLVGSGNCRTHSYKKNTRSPTLANQWRKSFEANSPLRTVPSQVEVMTHGFSLIPEALEYLLELGEAAHLHRDPLGGQSLG